MGANRKDWRIYLEYLVMLPGPTNVPERVTRAMFTHMINHRSKDFVKLYTDVVEKTQKVFDTRGDVVALSASGTGAVEASVVNMIKKGDKVIIPVNGEFSGRLATMLEWQGANVIRLATPFGQNASFEQVKEAFDNNKDVKAFYVVWNETSTGTMVRYLDKISGLTSRNDSFYLVDGMDNRVRRHRICSDALYNGLGALGLTPFANEDARSTVVIALNYLQGLDDKAFRGTLSEKFRVLVAGGFGDLKGKVFRVGCMGEVGRYHVMRTISAIASTLDMMAYKTNPEALKVAEEKLKAL